MRRHPFFGIVDPQATNTTVRNPSHEGEPGCQRRRTFLGQFAGMFAGGLGLFALRPAAGQQVVTPNTPTVPGTPSVVVTPGGSQVVPPGSQAGPSNVIRVPREGNYTTQAMGEEGGIVTTVTTYALGEEGGTSRPPGTVTTQAVGEEGGVARPPRYFYRGRRYWYGY
jgi:hypothetical protein